MGPGLSEVAADAMIDGNLYAQGNCWFGERALFHGAAMCAKTIEEQNDVHADDGITPNATVETGNSFEWSVAWPVTMAEGIERQADAPAIDVPPGNYESISLHPRAEITLRSGVYFMNSLYGDPEAIINIESNGDPIILYVKDSVTMRSALHHSTTSADFIIVYAGPDTVDLGGPFAGTVVAPNAMIRLAPLNGGAHEGSFFGKRVELEAHTPINFIPFDHWDWLMPPTISVGCVSRSAQLHSAALFSFENPLDFAVEIPRGIRNDIATDVEKHAPLQYFEPGVHEKHYWIPFIGEELCWTLAGETVCADSSTIGCTLTDYKNTLVKNDVQALEYKDSYPYLEDLVAPDGDWSFLPDSGGTFDFGLPTPTVASNSIWTFELEWQMPHYPLLLDMSYVIFSIGDESFLKHGLDLACDDCQPGYLMGEPVYLTLSNPNSAANIESGFSLRLFPPNGFPVFKEEFEVTPDGSQLIVNSNSFNSYDGYCFFNDIWWEKTVCVKRLSEKPRFCLNWEVQFAGGIGEDELASTAIQSVPASYVYAKLNIENGADPFDAWTNYYPLDKDGCVPDEFAPTPEQLTPLDSSIPVTAEIELAGKFEYVDAAGARTNTVWTLIDELDDVFVIRKTFEVNDYMSSNHFITVPVRNSAGEPFNNEFTKVAAIIGQLFQAHANGKDMGIVGSNETIHANFSEADFPYYRPSDGKLYLRKDGSGAAGSNTLPFGDASRKFSVAHEFGHLIQYAHVANFGTNDPFDYVVRLRDPLTGKVDTNKSPFVAVDECRCFVSKNMSDLHCMQSLALPNTGIGEGFANFYSSMLWNASDEDDCVYGYPKSMYVPDCPAGAVNCDVDNCDDPDVTLRCWDAEQVLATNNREVLDYLGGFPSAPKSGWKIVEGMVPLECNTSGAQSEWQKWRNVQCLDPAVATPDMKQLGVEMDWTRFYSELNRIADTDEQWSVSDMLRVLGYAAAINDTDNVAASPLIVTYDMMLDEADKDTDI
ncbi:MAG: hypothetical protein JXR45_02400, partial [Deltaproteobacteria bacterium]|nr:hypothetical protein [Deltaproteobacteria bacterium]